MTRIHAVVGGSMWPLHNGHVWLISQALKNFDRVSVAVSKNSDKSANVRWNAQKVQAVLDTTFMSSAPVVFGVEGLMMDHVRSRRATAFVRGIRGHQDIDFEHSMCEFNKNYAPEIDTVFFMCPSYLSSTSSSLVKSLMTLPNWDHLIKPYVPNETIRILRSEVK